MEVCKLCEKESTPWFHINGHICQDCYYRDKWISVKDELPIINELVLITDCTEVIPGFYSSMLEWCEIGGIETSLDIYYWMPFPEVPK